MDTSLKSSAPQHADAIPARPPPDRHVRSKADAILADLLASAGIHIDGDRPWDMAIHDSRTANRILAEGSLGFGEAYMDGWWDCAALDDMIGRIVLARLEDRVSKRQIIALRIANSLFNRQSQRRASEVGRVHYDLGNALFSAMLDSRLTYSCGYWATAQHLEEAQVAKLELVCRKLGLQPGMRLLDIGCGWGSLIQYAAERHGVQCVGLTISQEQAEFGRQRCAGLPIDIRVQDYRHYASSGVQPFDRVASIGMFEHVGRKNIGTYFAAARSLLNADGLFLLHTIGNNRRGSVPDPWMERHIFPNHQLQSLGEIADACQDRFTIEDIENFGADYDRTLLAWLARLDGARPQLASQYDVRFFRMMRYYLLASAAMFRTRSNQLWQLVLSPQGVPGGYRRPT